MKSWNYILEEYQRMVDQYYAEDDYGQRSAHGYGYFKALAEKYYVELHFQAQEIASLRQELNEMKADL